MEVLLTDEEFQEAIRAYLRRRGIEADEDFHVVLEGADVKHVRVKVKPC